MACALVEFDDKLVPAARAFNERMRAAGGDASAGFLLPEHAETGISRLRHYVVTEGDFIRGGCLLDKRSHWLSGESAEVWNIQAPLSEGMVDRAHASVAIFMMKTLLKQNPRIYAVGMGSESSPFARLVKALGWKLQPVPLLFRVLNGNRFLREARALREPQWRRRAAEFGYASRLGSVGFRLLHWRMPPASGQEIEEIGRFSDVADTLWEKQRSQWVFASTRDAAALNNLYPPGFRIRRWQLRDGAGWALSTLTEFQDHHHFGTMRVGTIADLVAEPERLPVLIEKVVGQLRADGADLVVSNQMDPLCQASLRARGFLQGPSNFLFASSVALTRAIGAGRVHLNRGDGDGLIHLATGDHTQR